MEPNDNQRIVPDVPEEHQTPSWPALVGRLILDITRVVEAEARLMRASIEPTLTSVLERWLLQLVIAALALMVVCCCSPRQFSCCMCGWHCGWLLRLQARPPSFWRLSLLLSR